MATLDNDNLSDDEIFFGKMTIKEVKKHVQMDKHRHSVMCNITKEDNESDGSLKIIETCSEPDLNISSSFDDSVSSSPNEFKTPTGKWNINSANNSFLELEKIVSEIDMQSTNEQKSLNNTLDVVDYILNNAPSIKDINIAQNETVNLKNNVANSLDVQNAGELEFKVQNSPLTKEAKSGVTKNERKTIQTTPKCCPSESLGNNCSHNKKSITNTTKTLKNKIANKTAVKVDSFKTPKTNLAVKNPKVSIACKTPSKTFQNVVSPVAAYIKNSIQVSTFKNVRPTKPLLGMSSIPVPLRSDKTKPDKENVNFPFVAHKSAKKVKVINKPSDDPDEMNVNSPWKKHLASSLPKPIVIKHIQKENIQLSKYPEESLQDESFGNLVLHQAEVSLCTIVSCNSEKKNKK